MNKFFNIYLHPNLRSCMNDTRLWVDVSVSYLPLISIDAEVLLFKEI